MTQKLKCPNQTDDLTGPYTVYRLTSPTRKKYIGMTSLKLSTRLSCGYKHNPFLLRAINKYGMENFKKEILAENLCRESAECLEIFYIASCETLNRRKGYNIDAGGLAKGFSEYTRKKLSRAAKKRHRKTTDKTKRKLRKKNKSRCKPFFCLNNNTIYMSLMHASRELGLTPPTVSRVLNHERKTVHGYRFIYLSEIRKEDVDEYAKSVACD